MGEFQIFLMAAVFHKNASHSSPNSQNPSRSKTQSSIPCLLDVDIDSQYPRLQPSKTTPRKDSVFSSQRWPRYFVVSSMNNECLLDLSPIKISKALTTAKVTSDPRVTKQKAGTLLIEVRTESDSKHLMSCEHFDELPVTITQHRTLNFSKGVVKNYQLRGMTEEEFSEVDGVNSAYRVIVRRDGKTITTNTWILTFNSVTPPPYRRPQIQLP